MVTIVNPTGTPTIIYNSSGKNIQSLVANSGDAFVDSVAIAAISEFTLLVIDCSGGVGSGAVAFSSSFNIGDVVAVTFTGGSDVKVYDYAGNYFGAVGTPGPYGQLIKETATNWLRIA